MRWKWLADPLEQWKPASARPSGTPRQGGRIIWNTHSRAGCRRPASGGRERVAEATVVPGMGSDGWQRGGGGDDGVAVAITSTGGDGSGRKPGRGEGRLDPRAGGSGCARGECPAEGRANGRSGAGARPTWWSARSVRPWLTLAAPAPGQNARRSTSIEELFAPGRGHTGCSTARPRDARSKHQPLADLNSGRVVIRPRAKGIGPGGRLTRRNTDTHRPVSAPAYGFV